MLLVDDDPMVRGIAQYVLLREHFDVLTASDGRNALKLSRHFSGHIDLLLSDVNMPGMSGPELADALTRERPETPTLLMTGHASADEIPAHLRPHVLSKPFTPTVLIERIAGILGKACGRGRDASSEAAGRRALQHTPE